jgi:peptidoglycan/xylan/chitin deacetylase (PgdA/CDA1 family)
VHYGGFVAIRGIGRLRQIARRVTNVLMPRAIILLYHRVAEVAPDPQLLCVSRSNFAEQLQVLRNFGRVVPLKALNQALDQGDRGECVIVVTFDDGYADNLYNAKPLLERYEVPASVFVTSGYLGSKREFWYDDLERILLHNGPLPERLRLNVSEFCYEWDLGAVAARERACGNLSGWNIAQKDDPTVRHSIYRSLFHNLHPLADRQRQKVLEDLATWAGMETTHRPTHRTLSPEEVVQLAEGGIIEIGSHTVSHPVLSSLPLAVQTEEITASKARLEEIVGYRIASFAYPFGGRSHYSDQTVTAVREAGFDWACSNFAGIVRSGTDPWQLPRFLVRNWDGAEFAANLRRWLDA